VCDVSTGLTLVARLHYWENIQCGIGMMESEGTQIWLKCQYPIVRALGYQGKVATPKRAAVNVGIGPAQQPAKSRDL